MSTTPDTVTCEPIPGKTIEGQVVGSTRRRDSPFAMLRVDVGPAVVRVPEEECR